MRYSPFRTQGGWERWNIRIQGQLKLELIRLGGYAKGCAGRLSRQESKACSLVIFNESTPDAERTVRDQEVTILETKKRICLWTFLPALKVSCT